MSKRNSLNSSNNTLLNYFTKSPATPKSMQITQSAKVTNGASTPSTSSATKASTPVAKKSLVYGKNFHYAMKIVWNHRNEFSIVQTNKTQTKMQAMMKQKKSSVETNESGPKYYAWLILMTPIEKMKAKTVNRKQHQNMRRRETKHQHLAVPLLKRK